jgi:hypothetical protein
MVRSATALVAILILSGFVWTQQVATHTVVRGDTLWDLAQRYYENPWDWRRIYEANQDQIRDPNLIYPDQVFSIPGRAAEVTDVAVEAAPRAPARPPARTGGIERTVFYQDTSVMRAGVVRASQRLSVLVARDAVYSAPWLERLGEEPERDGRIVDFAGGANVTQTPRGYDRVRLEVGATPVRVGDQLLVYRVERTIEGVGEVVWPTGVVRVSDVDGSEAVAIVTKEYGRMQFGDFFGQLPGYSLTPGAAPQPVSDGAVAMIMGFAGDNAVQDLGGIAFLDLGADGGISVGDEFAYVSHQAGSEIVEGRLQVVGVRSRVASARIVQMDDVVFEQGLVVRLTGKMR